MTREQLEISRQYLNSIDPKRDISCIVDRKIKKQTYDLAVIMPCYNVEKYVEEAVDSILHQETNFKVELIIVNDGSTDSTREIFFEDMERLGIEIDQPMYEQILDEIALTFVRTNDLELNVKVSVFFLTTEWFGKLHERFSTDNKYKSVLEKGMELESFQTYSDGCAILWNKRLVGE